MVSAGERGLHELGDGLFAYLQRDQGWGWSNAGLVTADGTSLLVDTLYDLQLTQAMLDAMRLHTERSPIDAAVNTHGNGDHCYGNELLPAAAEIYATVKASEEMQAVPPALFDYVVHAEEMGPEWVEFARQAFGAFNYEGITLRPPSTTFEGRIELGVGDRAIEVVEVGPAHTGGDAIVHVPDAGVVFTGDVLFIDCTPVMWEGPVSNWLHACERILALGAKTLVPGHGPITDASGVRAVQRYLTHVRDEARARFDAGVDAEAAADDIPLDDFDGWGEPERIAVTVDRLYCEFDPDRPATPAPELLVRMARWAARH